MIDNTVYKIEGCTISISNKYIEINECYGCKYYIESNNECTHEDGDDCLYLYAKDKREPNMRNLKEIE